MEHIFYQYKFIGDNMQKITLLIKTVANNRIAVILLLFFYVAVITIVSINVCEKTATTAKNSKELPIYSVDVKERKVALSFDAAWGNEDTGKILSILDKHDVKVTFFMTGGWVEKYPEDVKAIYEAGHDLANHSENHKQMSKLNFDQCVDEVMKVHTRVEELTGENMCLFRPPYGDYNDNLIKAVEKCGYYTIQWSVDTLVTRV